MELWATDQLDEDIRCSEERWGQMAAEACLPALELDSSLPDARTDGGLVLRMDGLSFSFVTLPGSFF